MTGKFDPYHRWLGIPAAEQPADYYRLLGLAAFENDPEVIRDAAERQMAHVRSYALGQFAELSQKILNELASAKACLLDPEKRAKYAALLKAKSSGVSRPKARSAATTPAQPSAATASKPAPTTGSRTTAARPTGAASAGKPTSASAKPQRPAHEIYAVAPATSAARKQTAAAGAQASVQPVVEAASEPASLPVSRFPRTQEPKKPAGFDWRMFFVKAGSFVVVLAMLAGILVLVNHLWTTSTTLNARNKSKRQSQPQPVADPNAPPPPPAPVNPSPKAAPAPVAPALQPIERQTVAGGRKIQFPVRLASAEVRTEDVVFSLADAPRWVSLDAAARTITCEPTEAQSPGSYSVTVRAANAKAGLHDDKTFVVVVVAGSSQVSNVSSTSQAGGNSPSSRPTLVPPRDEIGGSQPAPGATPTPGVPIAGTKPVSVRIELPSGTMITPAMIDAKPMVHRETDALLRKCQANSPDVVGFYQEGSRSAIAVLAAIKITKLNGSAILFHPQRESTKLNPKQYAAYRNDSLNGLLATWDEQGRRKYWGNYANGQRQGVCCLFDGDVLTAVMECSRNKTDAVHLIAANAVTKSFTGEEAMSDHAAGDVLAKLDELEKGAKEDARQLRERVKHGVQSQIGAMNNEKREAFEKRSATRAKGKDEAFRSWRRQTGVP